MIVTSTCSIGDFRRIGGPKKEREIYIHIYTGWLNDTKKGLSQIGGCPKAAVE